MHTTGDRDALAELWRSYNHLLLRYFRGKGMADPDDLASTVWVEVAGSLRPVRGRRGRLPALAVHDRGPATDRRHPGRRSADGTGSSEPSSEQRGRRHRPGRRRRRTQPTSSIVRSRSSARCPTDQAEAVLLRVLGDLSIAEVAEIMGRREGAVRVLVHRGLKRLATRPGVTDGRITERCPHRDQRRSHPRRADRGIALTGPPAELAGEEAAVSAMFEALHPVPARGGSRSRRGLTIAAVTVASLGVGGLVAAGPGFFFSPDGDDHIELTSDTATSDRRRPTRAATARPTTRVPAPPATTRRSTARPTRPTDRSTGPTVASTLRRAMTPAFPASTPAPTAPPTTAPTPSTARRSARSPVRRCPRAAPAVTMVSDAARGGCDDDTTSGDDATDDRPSRPATMHPVEAATLPARVARTRARATRLSTPVRPPTRATATRQRQRQLRPPTPASATPTRRRRPTPARRPARPATATRPPTRGTAAAAANPDG